MGDNRFFDNRMELPWGETQIDDVGDGRNKDRRAYFQKPGRTKNAWLAPCGLFLVSTTGSVAVARWSGTCSNSGSQHLHVGHMTNDHTLYESDETRIWPLFGEPFAIISSIVRYRHHRRQEFYAHNCCRNISATGRDVKSSSSSAAAAAAAASRITLRWWRWWWWSYYCCATLY